MSEHAFDAARRTGFRGWFWFPSLDPDEQLPPASRTVISQKVNWLYNNIDSIRVVIDALTLEEVDTGIWPKAATSDPAFNRLATELFHNTASDPRFFDVAEKESYYSAQWAIRRNMMMHGELFAQLVRSEDTGSARVNFIPPWRIGSPVGDDSGTDGVITGKLGAPIYYQVIDSHRRLVKKLPASDVLVFRERSWVGQTRSISPLAPVVRKMLSLDEIERAEAAGVLLRTRLAFAVEHREGDDGGPTLLPSANAVEKIDNGDNTHTLVQKIVTDGGEVEVADLPNGRSLRVIESQKGSGASEFLKWVLSGLGNVTLYPNNYVFDIAGIGQGTVYRGVQRRVQRVKNTVRQFYLIPQFCSYYYRFWLWQRIASGAFASVPEDWWRVRHICPADDSVDVGREGRLYDARVDSGKMSPDVYHGMNGEDAEDVEDEIIAATVRRLKKIAAAKKEHPEISDSLGYDTIFRTASPVSIDPILDDPEK